MNTILQSPGNYFGLPNPLPALSILKAGVLTCQYENGKLCYIRNGLTEVVRKIYPAVRDQHWNTVPFCIENEEVEKKDDSFQINYRARFDWENIQYFFEVTIEGKDDNSIDFFVNGKSESEFLRNRIGLCLLHPLAENKGRPCKITHIDGRVENSIFPKTISPHQPFREVLQMEWKPDKDTIAHLTFEGDVFETEDHRNWTDASYKTYSTPLDLPYPVSVKIGDIVQQRILLTVNTTKKTIPQPSPGPALTYTGNLNPFPRLGFSKTSTTNPTCLTELTLLKRLSFHHYRVEVHFINGWQLGLQMAATEAAALQVKLALVVFLTGNQLELNSFINEITNQIAITTSITVLPANGKATSQILMTSSFQVLKAAFPQIQIGCGTDFHFAEWNRNFFKGDFDFISYSISPQVHACDIFTIIENLAGLEETIIKAHELHPSVPIYISPVTLRPRNDKCSGFDDRLHTEFGAAWTLLCIAHLGGVEHLTLFDEASGSQGIVQNNQSPVYNWLKKLLDFHPVIIRELEANQPLIFDGLVVENSIGQKLVFLINFSPVHQKVTLPNGSLSLLPPCSITCQFI